MTTPYYVELELWRLQRSKEPGALALREYIARLCDAANEPRPDALGLPRADVAYTIPEPLRHERIT